MSENAQAAAQEEKPKLTPAEEASLAIKLAQSQNRQLNNLVQLSIRNYLAMLNQTYRKKQDVNAYRERKNLIESFERAVLFSFDFGVDNNELTLKETGELAQTEVNFASQLIKLKETGMLIMAGKMKDQEENLNKETQTETKDNTNE